MATYKPKKKIDNNGATEEILLPISSVDGLQTKLDDKVNKSGDTFTGEVKFGSTENFQGYYIKRMIGSLGAGTAYNKLDSSYKDGTWHRMWRLRFPSGSSFWGKIKITLYGGYSSFNASGVMSKSITCNFNTSSIYNNVGCYDGLGVNVEQDFRISEAIWNATASAWEILIWQKNLSGNNSPTIMLECWTTNNTNYINAFKGITAQTVELTQSTSYSAQKASSIGGTKTVTWAELPVYENPLGEEIATMSDLSNKANLSGGNTFSGVQTINAPTNVSGSETTTLKAKTSNGGAIIFGKEGPNSGTMIRLDQSDGTCRLRFRSSETAGAMVWEQPEQGAQLYVDLGKDGSDKHRVSFPSSAGTLALTSQIPTVNNGTLTIQKNGTSVGEFTANQSGNTTANITVPTTASDVGAAPKKAGVYLVKGNTTGTAGTWTGTSSDFTDYYDGLVVAYDIGIAGASTTTLNINGKGAKTVYLRGTTKLTTHYAVGTIILLVYSADADCWYKADYDANTNTQVRVYRQDASGYNKDYPLIASRTVAADLGTVGTEGSYEGVYGLISDTAANIPTTNPYTGESKFKTVTATTFNGNLSGNATTATTADNATKLGGQAASYYENKVTSVNGKTGAVTIDIPDISSKANLEGGNTFTGKQTLNSPASDGYSIDASGYVKGSWLQAPSTGKAGSNTGKVCVLDGSGWIYYRTPAEIVSDGGGATTSQIPDISGKANLSGGNTFNGQQIFQNSNSGAVAECVMNNSAWDSFTVRNTSDNTQKTAISSGYVWCQDSDAIYSRFNATSIYYGNDTSVYEGTLKFPTDISGENTIMAAPKTWSTGTSGTVKLPSAGLYEVKTTYQNTLYHFVVYWDGASSTTSEISITDIQQVGDFIFVSINPKGIIGLHLLNIAGQGADLRQVISYRKIGIA